MTFLTYAQNFEDVLLWRALGHIKNGFYIDAGANDPELHSVTKAFYDAGWWGINIEPMPSYQAQFAAARPRDINLAVAVGAEAGEITLFDTPDINGWASTDSTVAEAHRAEGVAVQEVKVPLRTLSDICAEHVRGEIHFLKIDVEGFEGEVLRGMDFQRWRPWVLAIEATMPNSRVTNHETWEHMVTGAGYRYAYFDGLNRYYVADEHAELLDVLNIQANVFDGFISHHLDKAWKRQEELGLMAQQAQAEAAEQHALSAAAHAELHHAQEQTARANQQAEQSIARADEAVWRADTAIASVNAAMESVAVANNAAAQASAAAAAASNAAEAAMLRASDNAAQRDQANQRAEAAIAASVQALEAAAEASRSHAAALQAMDQRLQAAQQAGADASARADHFETASHHAGQEILRLRGLLEQAAEQAAQQYAAQYAVALQLNAQLHQLQLHAQAMERSWRWRLGMPAGVLQVQGGRLKRAVRPALRSLVDRMKQSERMRRLLLPLVWRFPRLAERVLVTLRPPAPPPAPPAPAMPPMQPMPGADPHAAVPAAPAEPATAAMSAELAGLPLSVRAVLADLGQAIRHSND
ncbi:FkbM family methyltransferase [Pseudoduganella sp. LjRoot289]|uniref:FkbM family methyltransferase n=1 Tax=Pseudoduganella sp. LjRoot289 TaxID=3342314 RepID=UPI003ECD02BF